MSIRAAELFQAKPWSHKLWLVARGLVTRDTLQAASAMAFDLFLAAIPMLALAGWLFARMSQGSDAVLTSASLLVDLTPSEVRSLIWNQLGQFSVTAVAPFALLGALWLASSAFNTLMAVLEVTVGATRRPWWQRRLIALSCVVMSIVLFMVSGTLAVSLAGGPSAVLKFVAQGQNPFLDRASHFLLLGLVLLIATALLSGFFRIAVIREWRAAARLAGSRVDHRVASGSASLAFAYYASPTWRVLRYFTWDIVSHVTQSLSAGSGSCASSRCCSAQELNLQLGDLSGQRVKSTHTPQPSGNSAAD